VKKFIFALIVSVLFICALFIIAFLYIAFTGHEILDYEFMVKDRLAGVVRVDRYITEDRIIYKSREFFDATIGYPCTNRKITIKRMTLLPVKYEEEAMGARGASAIVSLTQNRDKTNYMYFEPPVFFTMKDFETGHSTSLYSPYNMILYFPVMEKYNYWKKGTQYFEVMIPVEGPFPIMRDKIEVTYIEDDYIAVLNKRIEAERFAIRGKSVPETIVTLSKNTHELLSLEIPKSNINFTMIGYHRRFDKIFNIIAFLSGGIESDIRKGAVNVSERITRLRGAFRTGNEVFFENGSDVLSGNLWVPDGLGPFPAAIIVPEDGPMTQGEKMLIESLGEKLSAAGIIVLYFDYPGQGKSQGDFTLLNDDMKKTSIVSAFSFVADNSLVDQSNIVLIGHRGGGYLAIKAADEMPTLSSCVLLGLPFDVYNLTEVARTREGIAKIMTNYYGLGKFDTGYTSRMSAMMNSDMEEVKASSDEVKYFMNKRLPVKAYCDYLSRRPYEAIVNFGKPFLMVFGRDDRTFRGKLVDGLKALAGSKNINLVIFPKLGPYLGEVRYSDAGYDFNANEDMTRLVRNWILSGKYYSLQEMPKNKAPLPVNDVVKK